MTQKSRDVHRGSIRDPAGRIFRQDGVVYRRIELSYKSHYEFFRSSGLYEALREEDLLLPFREVSTKVIENKDVACVLRPTQLDYVSYPYEWCFSHLRDAALTTLRIQELALQHGMTLKDATPFNVQLVRGKQLLIDHLSFEIRQEESTWVAYRQFCELFYGPLLLASYKDPRVLSLMRVWPEGIPLDLIANLLPRRAYLKLSHFLHVGLHGWLKSRSEERDLSSWSVADRGISGGRLADLVVNLAGGIRDLECPVHGSQWADYEVSDSYSEQAAAGKRRLVRDLLLRVEPDTVIDFGANRGEFSAMAAEVGANVVAIDSDHESVEQLYERVKTEGDLEQVTPLYMNLLNPSPALGWANQERYSLTERRPASLAMALALIHHLVIGHNIPLEEVARFLTGFGRHLLVEFVPPDDPQVRQMLGQRATVGHGYSEPRFLSAIDAVGRIVASHTIPDSHRTLYLVEATVRSSTPA